MESRTKPFEHIRVILSQKELAPVTYLGTSPASTAFFGKKAYDDRPIELSPKVEKMITSVDIPKRKPLYIGIARAKDIPDYSSNISIGDILHKIIMKYNFSSYGAEMGTYLALSLSYLDIHKNRIFQGHDIIILMEPILKSVLFVGINDGRLMIGDASIDYKPIDDWIIFHLGCFTDASLL